jgi:glyoxylase-like metal-dependent hydrolase (beta-lactamase superfamily II)
MGYEVLAIRYLTRQTIKSEVYLNYHVYGEPDAPVDMDYFCWVIRDDTRTVVVDTGFSAEGGALRCRTLLADPVDVLTGLGIDAGTVPQVLVTHAHYDHIGGLPAYRRAEVIMAQREYDFWTGPLAARKLYAHWAEQAELDHLAGLRSAE